jgi:hypothetical protein
MKIEKLEIEEYPILIMEMYQGSYGSLGSVYDRHIEGYGELCEIYEEHTHEPYAAEIDCQIAVEITVVDVVNLSDLVCKIDDNGTLGLILGEAINEVRSGGLFDDLFEYYINQLKSIGEPTDSVDDIDFLRFKEFLIHEPLTISPFDCAGHFEILDNIKDSKRNLKI